MRKVIYAITIMAAMTFAACGEEEHKKHRKQRALMLLQLLLNIK